MKERRKAAGAQLTYMEILHKTVQQKNSHTLKKASGLSDVEDLVKQLKFASWHRASHVAETLTYCIRGLLYGGRC